MKNAFAIAAVSALASIAGASGVGLHHYNPTQVLPPQHACPSGACSPSAACSSCGVRAFAGVDGATPPPCAAEGVCYPKYETFGFYQTNWRRWPGDSDTSRPEPTEATAGDDLLAPFDAPPKEREDQQAPPPIEEDPGATLEDEDDLPPLDIDLPPLPERRPFNAPFDAPPEDADDGPPALPFGAVDTPGPAVTWRPAEQSTSEASTSVRRLPDFPADVPPEGQSPTPRTAVRGGVDAPPPLPGGFTLIRLPEVSSGVPELPTLGRPQARFDAAVRQASAVGPVGSPSAR